jgi:hypothetical protein
MVSPTLPPMPTYEHTVGSSLLLGKEAGIWIRLDPIGDIQFTDQERQLIEFSRANLWIFGFFTYTSYFKQSFDAGFIARWDLKAGLLLETRPNYTYEREITK